MLAHRVQAPAPAKFIFAEKENIFLIDIYYENTTKTFHKSLVLFDLFFNAANVMI